MPIIVRDVGPIKLTIRYVHKRKSDGVYFYYRRVPRDLKHHFPKAGPFIRRSLATKEAARAAERAIEHASRDDALWSRLRSSANRKVVSAEPSATGILLTKALENRRRPPPIGQAASSVTSEPLLNKVTEDYLRHHSKGRVPVFVKVTRLGIAAVLKTAGDLPLREYTRQHARETRDHLLSSGNRTGTVRRRLRTIIPVFNHGISEYAPDVANVFSKLKIPQEATDSVDRQPFALAELRVIADACQCADDDLRHLIAILLDTGARLSEIVGLRRQDLSLAGPVPHLWIREDLSVGRTLKLQTATVACRWSE